MKSQKNRASSGRKNKKLRDVKVKHNRTLLVSRNGKKKRSCLMCGKMFESNGPFNRRCPKCNRMVELGKGGGVSMPHVYKVSTKEPKDFIGLIDIDFLKE